MFEQLQPIYYFHRNGDTYPGIVLWSDGDRVRIKYNGLDGDVKATVKSSNIEAQN